MKISMNANIIKTQIKRSLKVIKGNHSISKSYFSAKKNLFDAQSFKNFQECQYYEDTNCSFYEV